jgi:hypothetical protein
MDIAVWRGKMASVLAAGRPIASLIAVCAQRIGVTSKTKKKQKIGYIPLAKSGKKYRFRIVSKPFRASIGKIRRVGKGNNVPALRYKE